MRDGLVATLNRILEVAEQRGLVDEMRGSVAYKAPCPKCDDTGWMMLTSGTVTTAGGHEVTATELAPVARRCAKGCPIPMKGRTRTEAAPTKRELKP